MDSGRRQEREVLRHLIEENRLLRRQLRGRRLRLTDATGAGSPRHSERNHQSLGDDKALAMS